VKKWLILGPVLLVLGTAAFARFHRVRQDLISQRESMHSQWTEVRSLLEQRAQMAPVLADAVKARARSGDPVFREVARSRSDLEAALRPEDTLQANARLSRALWGLLALSENDPRLRADADFQRLQDELADIENDIAVQRQKYNEALEHYNAQLQRFPDNVVASLSGFTRNDAYFQTESAERAKPKE
jgi:LemA protein